MTPNNQVGHQAEDKTASVLGIRKFTSGSTTFTPEEVEKQVQDLLDMIPVIEEAEKKMREREKNKVKDFMTPKDKELMLKWENEFPEWIKENRNKITFGPDYIGFELESGKIIKLDREDLGQSDWNEAINKSEKLGKRLPTIEEFKQMINLMPGDRNKYEKLRELAGFLTNYYWSSIEYNDYLAYYQGFINGSQANCNKFNSSYIRCIRED